MRDLLLAGGLAVVLLVAGILLLRFRPSHGSAIPKSSSRTVGVILILCSIGLVVGQAMVTFGAG
ncbi:hypothetical protein [Gulosibacter sp. 10]|uniref:hypothetical protein n=1 Tax=Gulosibacter sp. 10 TaxID=1255570 RepID=UPI00097F6165|nr:hypothetical protein [Gulosibacter sp. 10]SJM63272.1 hypothetical protein FM112_09080 [Gulosibacter sp. 10]